MDVSGLRIDLAVDEDVFMRPVVSDDVSQVLGLVTENYDHLRPFMEWAKPDYGLQDAHEWVQKSVDGARTGTQLNFLIFRGDRMIGIIGFASFDHDAKVAEIGYWIDKVEQGKGITVRACRMLVDLAFDRLAMNRIQIRCAHANERSAAIPMRLGFTEEGVQRRHVMRDGKIYDFVIFGLLRDEWSSSAVSEARIS